MDEEGRDEDRRGVGVEENSWTGVVAIEREDSERGTGGVDVRDSEERDEDGRDGDGRDEEMSSSNSSSSTRAKKYLGLLT
jgi:hypothetical protein